MFRVTIMSGNIYAKDIGDNFIDIQYDDDEMEAIQCLVTTGSPVIICEELEELEVFGINTTDIKIVDEI